MAAEFAPKIGDWYKNVHGDSFEIVATDDDDETVEIQYFDGTLEELDLDAWRDMPVTAIEPPEDWSGSMDIEREDYGVDLERNDNGAQWANPLDSLDQED